MLKKWDFYKKIPEDLTVSTLPGVGLSVTGCFLMFILFMLEFNAYLSTSYATTIVMDEGLDAVMRINFNVTIPDLRCEFASLDVSDMTGTRKHNMTQDIYKIRIDHKQRMIGMATVEQPKPRYAIDENLGELPESDAVVVALTDETFEAFLKEHTIVAIDYYAPWCIWCKRLEPTWLRTAKTLPSLHFGQRVRVASVDCEAHPQVCMRQFIRAYPSILFYKNGDPTPIEMYHGDRSVDAFSSKFKMLMDGEADYAEVRKKELHANDKLMAHSNGEVIQHMSGPEGCQIYGHLEVKRVPGNFHIHLSNPAYSTAANLVNATHFIGELWFGKPLTRKQLRKLPKSAHAELYSHRLEGQNFVAFNENHTYVHYVKVVTNTFVQPSGEEIYVYKYTAHSNEYLETKDLPSVMFRYDLSPMSVRVSEVSTPFYHFITNACAIVGGVFTVIGIIDQIVHQTGRAFNKKVL